MLSVIKKIEEMERVLRILFVCFIWGGTLSAKETHPRRNAVKATFLSWFSGSSKVSYERAVFDNQTMELTVGYIGLGHDKYKNDPKGETIRYAHKFIISGNSSQPLNGFYLRPELIYSRFYYNTKGGNSRDLSEMGSIIGSVGYQYVIHQFVLDAYFGGGYTLGKESDTHYQHGFSLWEYFGSLNKHIAMTFGLKLGISF